MSRYCTSIFFILVCAMVYAQDGPVDLNKKDTVVYKQPYGFRVGVDLSRVLVSFLEENYTGLEFVGDYRLTQNLYLASELGNEEKTIGVPLGNEVNNPEGDLYSFTASGSYLKLGIDYNTYGNWYGEQNMIYIGGRYAFSTFSQTLNNYKIFTTDRYWNPDDFAVGTTQNQEFSGLTASWLEFVLGVKAEILKNLYFGASVRLGILITNKNPENFRNLFIPGFNKVTDDSRFGVGYNYSISYLIPLYKKDKKTKEKAMEAQPPPQPVENPEDGF